MYEFTPRIIESTFPDKHIEESDQDQEITPVLKETGKANVGKSYLDQFQATEQLESVVGQVKDSVQAALPANDSILFAAEPTAEASSPPVNEPALGSSSGSMQEASTPAAPPEGHSVDYSPDGDYEPVRVPTFSTRGGACHRCWSCLV